MPVADIFGVRDGIKRLTPPVGLESAHRDGFSWPRAGERWEDTSKWSVEDWARIAANLRQVVIDSGLDLSGLDADAPDLLSSALQQLIVDFIDPAATRAVRVLSGVGGTANAITAAVDPDLVGAPVGGMLFTLPVSAANTGAVTLTVAGDTTARPIVDASGNALTAGTLAAGSTQLLIYDGAVYRAVLIKATDMLRPVYDPGGKNANAFAMANMDEGPNAKIMTADERLVIRVAYTVASRASLPLTIVPPLVTVLRVLGYASAADGGEALYRYSASEPTHPGKVQSADGKWWELSAAIPNPRMVGALGGDADDAVALQRFCDLPHAILSLNGSEFRTTVGLTLAGNRRMLRSDGGRIVGDANNITVLLMTGDDCRLALEISGNGKAANGVRATGARPELRGCNIYNLRGNGAGVVAVQIDNGGRGCLVTGNIIRDLFSTPDGTFGNGPGAARAVLVNSSVLATEDHIVTDNTVDDVLGEEGDAIQFLFYDGATVPYLDARGFVLGNRVRRLTRRAVKIQASNVKVRRNDINNQMGEADLPNAVAAINVIAGLNVVVHDNDIDCPAITSVIHGGLAGFTGCNPSVKRNRCSVNNYGASGNRIGTAFITVDYSTGADVEGNTLTGTATGIVVVRTAGGRVCGNTLNGGDAAAIGINILSTSSNIIARFNDSLTGSRLYLIQNDAPGCTITHNAGFGATTCVRSLNNDTGSWYDQNANSGTGTTIILNSRTNKRIGAHINMGSGASGNPFVFFTAADPATEQPGLKHNVGDVALAVGPVASGSPGRVCTTAGTPGVWKALPNLAA